MSKSRSTTPTNTNTPSLQSTSLPTTSRHQIHENPPIHVGEREEQSTESRIPSSSATPVPSSAERHPRPTPSPPATMAKRLRKETPPPSAKKPSRSSPSSDSQDGMADTEDGNRSQRSEKSPPPAAPPKKKRTRTLTTPHQSAVLHALLAQSRFPTTAMREEVGRSIGLSARKVQIWFQNQRQKARRPRTSDDTSRVYGAFPQSTADQLGASTALPAPRPLPIESRPVTYPGPPIEDPRYPTPSSAHPTDSSRYSSGSVESTSRLLGPGMPGSDTRARSYTRRYSPPESPVAGPSSRQIYDLYSLRRSHSPPRHLRQSRPTSSHTIGDIIDRDSRTLPPLIFPPHPPPLARPSTGSVPPGQRSAPPSMAPFIYPRSPSPPFAHRIPESSGSMIPPPFTLQPAPQWDQSQFTTIPSSAHSSWSSRPGSRSAHEGSPSPTSPRSHPPTIHEEIELESSQAAAGRYDPVRASLDSGSSVQRPARAAKDYPHSA